jgi:hypothetical protein
VDNFVENLDMAYGDKHPSSGRGASRHDLVISLTLRIMGLAHIYQRFGAKPLGQPRHFSQVTLLCISQALARFALARHNSLSSERLPSAFPALRVHSVYQNLDALRWRVLRNPMTQVEYMTVPSAIGTLWRAERTQHGAGGGFDFILACE